MGVVKERSEIGEIVDGEGAVTKDVPDDETRLCLSNPEGLSSGAVRIETRLAIHQVCQRQ